MARLKNSIDKIVQRLTDDFNNPHAGRTFFKALVVLTFVKILLLWAFSQTVVKYHKMTLPGSLIGKVIMAPSFLANANVDVFLAIAVVFLVAAFLLKPSYFTTILFFWLTFNLYIVYLPFASGADLVLFMLALWCIPVAIHPTLSSETGDVIQKTAHNSGIILCQLQVVFIYLVSGWDKLSSEVWRSGEAFDYITHLGNMFNPMFSRVFDHPLIQLILSWATILFELAFVVLVWFRKTKIPMLIIGILFHVFIWFVLSLPDFAAIMIISYIIFLSDDELARLRSLIRR